jgi:endogenous inhibitor of DNA gyrase (YacG/DUF329 family)
MAGAQIGRTTKVLCPHCGQVVVEGAVSAAAGTCPHCGKLYSWPDIGLEFGNVAVEELARTLEIINHNGGYGRLIVDFQKGKAARVGLGESLRDVRGCGG